MEASELRLGNFVKTDNSTNNLIDIETVDYFVLKEIIEDSDFYSPIPLTEEWFLMLGFEAQSLDWFTYNGFGVCIYKKKLKISFKEQILLLNIYHVHQLQNLFYCLVGKELVLKE
jgi:hypothetical protein